MLQSFEVEVSDLLVFGGHCAGLVEGFAPVDVVDVVVPHSGSRLFCLQISMQLQWLLLGTWLSFFLSLLEIVTNSRGFFIPFERRHFSAPIEFGPFVVFELLVVEGMVLFKQKRGADEGSVVSCGGWSVLLHLGVGEPMRLMG